MLRDFENCNCDTYFLIPWPQQTIRTFQTILDGRSGGKDYACKAQSKTIERDIGYYFKKNVDSRRTTHNEQWTTHLVLKWAKMDVFKISAKKGSFVFQSLTLGLLLFVLVWSHYRLYNNIFKTFLKSGMSGFTLYNLSSNDIHIL